MPTQPVSIAVIDASRNVSAATTRQGQSIKFKPSKELSPVRVEPAYVHAQDGKIREFEERLVSGCTRAAAMRRNLRVLAQPTGSRSKRPRGPNDKAVVVQRCHPETAH